MHGFPVYVNYSMRHTESDKQLSVEEMQLKGVKLSSVMLNFPEFF